MHVRLWVIKHIFPLSWGGGQNRIDPKILTPAVTRKKNIDIIGAKIKTITSFRKYS